MAEPTPTLDLDVIEALWSAATLPPWRLSASDDGFDLCAAADDWSRADGVVDDVIGTIRDHPNAWAIADARTTVPALVARVRALEAEVARLRAIPFPDQGCVICGTCPVVARDADEWCYCVQHAGSDCTPF